MSLLFVGAAFPGATLPETDDFYYGTAKAAAALVPFADDFCTGLVVFFCNYGCEVEAATVVETFVDFEVLPATEFNTF